MYGLDRACIYAEVKTDIRYVREAIKILYPHCFSESLTNHTNNYLINKKNINFIKLEEKALKKTTVIKIDFSYPRYFDEDNTIPLDDELKKIIVENDLLDIINKITDYEIRAEDLEYDYFEFTTQEQIGNFYKYHNIVSLFYKALTRKYEDLDKTQYYNFNKNENRFYTTGFIFQPTNGWKIRLYSKGHENNKKEGVRLVKGAIIRLEHRISKNIIKKHFLFKSIKYISISEIREFIKNTMAQTLGKLIIEEFENSNKIIKEKFKDFKCRELDGLIRDNLEWIFDYKILDDIVTNYSLRPYRTVVFYRKRIKEILLTSQAKASPQREFFSNVERLELFLKNLILFDCRVKISTKNHLQIFLKK